MQSPPRGACREQGLRCRTTDALESRIKYRQHDILAGAGDHDFLLAGHRRGVHHTLEDVVAATSHIVVRLDNQILKQIDLCPLQLPGHTFEIQIQFTHRKGGIAGTEWRPNNSWDHSVVSRWSEDDPQSNGSSNCNDGSRYCRDGPPRLWSGDRYSCHRCSGGGHCCSRKSKVARRFDRHEVHDLLAAVHKETSTSEWVLWYSLRLNAITKKKK